jgi:hypothetical protein
MRWAGEPSVLPAGSVARTANVCEPFARPEMACGDEQAVQLPASSRHSKVEPDSELENANSAPRVDWVSTGPESIVVSGAVVSPGGGGGGCGGGGGGSGGGGGGGGGGSGGSGGGGGGWSVGGGGGGGAGSAGLTGSGGGGGGECDSEPSALGAVGAGAGSGAGGATGDTALATSGGTTTHFATDATRRPLCSARILNTWGPRVRLEYLTRSRQGR